MSTTNADGLGRQLCFIEPEEVVPNQNGQVMPASRQSRRKPTARTEGFDADRFTALLREELNGVKERIAAVQALLESILNDMEARAVKEYYTTLEVARILQKKPYTVREWCRLGRVNAQKAFSGRGLDDEWRISHEELVRIQNEGLLETKSETHVRSAGRINHPR